LLAAGELSESDVERLTLHVASCRICSERLSEAVALLRESGVDAAREVSPPPNVKAQLMARVAAAQPRRPRWAGLAAAAALAAALLGSAAVGWIAQERFAPAEETLRFELALVRETGRKREQRIARLSARLEELERSTDAAYAPAHFASEIGPGRERARAWRTLLQWTEESRPIGARPLQPRAQAKTTAQVFCLESEGLCVLRAAGLPAPQTGQSYALWLTNVVGRYYLVGTFEVDANGEASLLASAPVDVRDVARSVITLEPGEAGWRPAGSVVLVDEVLPN
jgi:hypothetical protein